jgi:hypothetical protein
MSLREKWKKAKRKNYELSILELEKRRRNKKIQSVCIFMMYLIFLACFLWLILLSTNWIFIGNISDGLIVFFISSLIFFGVYILYTYITYLDLSRDCDFIDIMIYLKMVEK